MANESPAPRPPSRPPRGRRALRWLGGMLAALLALVLVAAGALWWSLAHERGSAWLLSRLPGVEVVRPHGSLLGDFGADALVVRFGQGGELRLAGLAWQRLSVGRSAAPSAWMRVDFSRLQVQQAWLTLPAPAQDNRSPPPHDLDLPVELSVDSLQVEELHAAALGEAPLRELRLRGLHLHDHGGEVHRLDAFSVARGPLLAEGRGRLQAQPPMQGELALALRQPALAGWPAWRAQLQLTGPLAQAALSGTLRADTTPAQTLAVDATVQPFAAWPLARLNAHAQGLDVSALLAGGPQTALSGDIVLRAADAERPLDAQVNLVNHLPGAWDAGRVPVRRVLLSLAADPRDRSQLQLQQLQAELGTAEALAGRVSGDGRWSAAQGWSLQARLQQVRPDRLDARAPALLLDGELNATGQDVAGPRGQPAARRTVELDATLAGRLPEAPRRAPLQLSLKGGLASTADGQLRLELQRFAATHGPARATLQGWAQRDTPAAPWRTEARLAVDEFDPQPWWPALPWRQASRLNAQASAALTLPPAAPGVPLLAWLPLLQGRADLQLAPSALGGVPLQGEAQLRGSGSAEGLQARVQADAAGNALNAEGRLARDPARDHWEARLAAPAIERLIALLPDRSALSGSVHGELSADGRWPRVQTQGQLQARQLVVPGLQMRQADAQWRLGTSAGAPVALQLALSDLQLPGGEKARRAPSARLQVDGTADAHRIALQADLAAAPPAWTTALQPSAATGPRTLARLQARGGLLHGRDAPADITGWRGRIDTLDLRRAEAAEPLLRTVDVGLAFHLAGASRPAALQLQPGRAQALGGALRWSRLDWQGGQGTAPAQLDADVTLEPMQVAPLLARLQPAYGWTGDLSLAGHLRLHTAPVLRADLLLQRHGGDLQMVRGSGRRALGLSLLRVSAQAEGTVWKAEARAAGEALGTLAARLGARTTPSDPWPDADTPVQGTLALQAADLGVYDPWLPVGWRLGGTLSADARIGGRIGAPQYAGRIQGRQLAVSHFVEGVRVRDGELEATLAGDRLRIERFVAHAGDGVARIEGGATLGAQPSAQFSLKAERFQALSRVDRRITVSGNAQLALDAQHTRLQGRFAVDDGLVDLGRGEAPELSKDVQVVDDPRQVPLPGTVATSGTAKRALQVDLRVDLGGHLRVQGRGVNTLLAGDVRVTAPDGQLQLHGTVRTEQGSYQAYGEKLRIERGLIAFRGPVADPGLDILAVRPDLRDVEVGVAITGTAQNPRVRLTSTPEMSELDKLSWLTMGRASEGLASDQTALLQRAALALLAGQKGGGGGEGLAKRLGLDALSVKRGESGGFSDAVVTLGKQVSERFYVGYQQSLDATGMGWELIYKIAKRFTVRVQTGDSTAVDLVWTWLWG